jgi:hypothetical protein
MPKTYPMEKLTWEEVRDELITDYCNDRCKKYMSDYYCPDHNCVVYLTLNFCNDGLNNYPTKRHRIIKSPPKPRPILSDRELTNAITKETGYQFGVKA